MFRGGPIFLLQMKDMHCCKANKYDMHVKKVNLIQVRPLKGDNGRHLVFYYTNKGIHIHLSPICNKSDSCRIYMMIICHLKVLEFRMLHVRLYLMQFTSGTLCLKNMLYSLSGHE